METTREIAYGYKTYGYKPAGKKSKLSINIDKIIRVMVIWGEMLYRSTILAHFTQWTTSYVSVPRLL